MKYFWIAALVNLCIFTISYANRSHLCCDNEENLMTNSSCSTATGARKRISLTCDEKFTLDKFLYPEDDEYVTLDNGSLSVPTLGFMLPYEDYCIVNKFDEDRETHEIVVVCYRDNFALNESILTFTIRAVLIFISVVFILLTLYVYYLLPELRETQDKVTIITLINLAAFLFFLGILQTEHPRNYMNEHCIFISYLVFFFSIAYFAWLNCTLANVWRIIVLRKWKVKEQNWFLASHIYAWSIPIVATTIIAMQNSNESMFATENCWFHDERDQMIFMYLPISIMLTLNVIFCLWSSLHLMFSDFSPDARKALRYKSILYLKIFLLGGVTWIFEILSFIFMEHKPSAWIWLIGDFLNCLHGVLIFIILIVWRQRIRKELAGKKMCCLTFPAKWADIDDDEEICLDGEEGDKSKYDMMIKTLN